jgi:hypothetical protein
VIAALLLSFAAATAPGSTHSTVEPREKTTAVADRLGELQQLSAALIERAASGGSPAHQFRIETRIYRELLRRMTLDDRAQPATVRLPQTLLLDMVRMSALLHAAADCKTGLVITCPPNLMRELRSQQSRVDKEMALYRLASD